MARYALVVGIAEYKLPLRSLQKTATDAEAVAQVLRQHGNFQQVEILSGQVTGVKLGQGFRTFLLEQTVKSEALIYFTGHGITVFDNLGRQEAYLATSDCAIATESNQIVEQRRGIALASLNGLIRDSDLSSLVVLLDCCHSGHFLERDLVEQTLTAFSLRKDYYLITACRGFQEAYAMKSEKHSIFTGAMLNGLSPENAGNDGQISGDRLFDFIATALRGSGQEPIRMGWGRSITLVRYQPKKTAVFVDETSPYQGLEPFGKEQARFFFGREKVIQLLMEKLGQVNFVPLIGGSGSGKSSVVRAGLIPKLEKNGWRVLEPILPGVEPLAELKRALTQLFGRTEVREVYSLIDTNGLRAVIERLSGSERVLLVVDQFEEVFTVCLKEDERQQFIELLTQVSEMLASRLAIVITMRADFLEPCLHYQSLTQLIQTQAVYIPPLEGEDLEQAIREPAELKGYCFESGLLGAIFQDVGQEKGCLPLLQFALTELWEQRNQQTHQLTLVQYRQQCGVVGALNRHAEQIYESFTKRQQDWVKRIFLRLVRTAEDAKDTRQRQPKSKLLAIAGDNAAKQQDISKVLDELVHGRLLVTGQDQEGEAWVDLAHEALMEGWERFGIIWRQEDRELRRLIDRIEDALREWSRNPQNENLMMGGLLAKVRERWLELKPNLHPLAERFYHRSKVYEEGRSAAVQEALLREQATRVLNLLLDKPVEGLILAIQTTGQSLDECKGEVLSPVQFSLQEAIEVAREQNIFRAHENWINVVTFSRDGQYIASGSQDGTVQLWNLQGNKMGLPFKGHEGWVMSVAFNPNGQCIASGGADKTIRLWDLQGNPMDKPFQGHEGSVSSVAFSPNGKYIVSGSWDGTMRLWDRQGNPMGKPFQGHEGWVMSVALSPDAQCIASGGVDKTVRLWNLQGNRICQSFRGHAGAVNSVSFSPNSEYIVSGSKDGTVRLWNRQGNPMGKPFQGHAGAVNSVSFSPNGEYIVSGSEDGTVRLWDRQGNPMGKPFQGHAGWVMSVAFSPNGEYIVSGSEDGTVRLWDRQGNPMGKPFQGHEGLVMSVAFNPDGQCIASGGTDQTIRLWDLQGNPMCKTFQGHEGWVNSVSFSPDGQTIVSGSEDETVRLWDRQGNPMDKPLKRHRGQVYSVTFSLDGQCIFSSGEDGTVQLWRRGWKGWLQVACDRLRYHPVFKNPETDLAIAACEVCQKYVWSKTDPVP